MMPFKRRRLREHRLPRGPAITAPGVRDMGPEERQLPGHWQDFVCAQLGKVGMTIYR
ncbi:MAG TPA: hypothetical protein VHS52_01200 [Acidimicrobiales bacterium]|jgi:hypothetical protein|nr:hypothetical protein [Acidimicrobiales bacterium]